MNELSSCEMTPQQTVGDSSHTFILRSIDGSHKVIEDIEIDLSLNQLGSKLASPNIAVFNEDHKPYTPAFVEHSQQAELVSHDRDFKTYFQTKIKCSNALQSDQRRTKSQAYPYCLSPNSNFCLICHQHFDNYFKHINHPVHVKNEDESIGKEYIFEIVSKVNEEAERREKVMRAMHKKIRKQRKGSHGSGGRDDGEQENQQDTQNFQSTQLLPKHKA